MNVEYLELKDVLCSNFIERAKLEVRPRGKAGSRFKGINYKKLVCAFDIETTALKDVRQSIMYVWQFNIPGLGCIIGRTWNEFRIFVKWICRQLKESERIVCYVHFLGHEFQYLKGIYDFSEEDVFAIDSRNVGKCLMCGRIEFRCSYMLSNQSLKSFLKDMKVEHLKGEMDYSIKRYPYTALSDDELSYCINDVVGLSEAVERLMAGAHDTLYTVPLTSTGYIRRDIKKAMHDFNRNNRHIYDISPDLLILAMQTFRGGDTGANRYYSGKVIERGDLGLFKDDKSSSYPSSICMDDYPMGKWRKVTFDSIDEFIDAVNEHRFAYIFRITFRDICLNNRLRCDPYISVGKCINFDAKSMVNCNGRVIECSSITVGLTDIDMRIINDIYMYRDAELDICYECSYGLLPQELRDVFVANYQIKTSKKGVEGENDAYQLAKRKFNAGYGCMVQSPLRPSWKYKRDKREIKEEDLDINVACEEYRNKAFLSYFWGIWTTAHAREELHKGISIVGDNFTIYWDTDGIDHCNPDEHVFDEYNNRIKERAIVAGLVAVDKNGITHYGGVFEREARNITRFKTYGAKKYVTEYEDGELEITISGVSKLSGSEELKRNGGIENWTTNTVFEDCGRSTFHFNDNVVMTYVTEDAVPIVITDNVYSEESKYSMSISPEYNDIIRNVNKIYKIYRQMNRSVL